MYKFKLCYKAGSMLLLLFFVSSCGMRIDLAQRQLHYKSSSSESQSSNDKEGSDGAEEGDEDKEYKEDTENSDGENDSDSEKDDIINPGDSSEIDNSGNNVEDTSEGDGDNGEDKDNGNSGGNGGNSNTGGDGDKNSLPLVQRQTIRLKDGRTIVINNADIVQDSERLQIRKTEDLVYTGLHPTPSQIAQTGLLQDEKNKTIFPVVILGHGRKTNDIPSGGTWEGDYYGQFQGENHAYDVYGFAGGNVDLSTQSLSGQVEYLSTSPSLTHIPPQATEGTIFFNGAIKDGEWSGQAHSQGLINPENGQAFKETSGSTEGVFITATEGPATEAAGHITLTDENNKGLVGTINMQHLPD